MENLVVNDFVENEKGELALVVAEFSTPADKDPHILISRDDPTAYLYRGGYETHVLDEINPKIIERLRKAVSLQIWEVDPKKILKVPMDPSAIKTSYDVLVSLMDSPTTGKVPKNLVAN